MLVACLSSTLSRQQFLLWFAACAIRALPTAPAACKVFIVLFPFPPLIFPFCFFGFVWWLCACGLVGVVALSLYPSTRIQTNS
eukprot:m.476666 g.476666  ORF g.476666 m.476666 type:complete len:83 (+) comp20609_c0_seq1:1025-1273(+)